MPQDTAPHGKKRRKDKRSDSLPPAPSAARFEEDGLRFEIRPNPDFHVLEILTQGRMTPQNMARLARQISALAESHGYQKVLLDHTRSRIDASMMEIYEDPVRMEKTGLSRALKLAVCYESDAEKLRFWETVSRNRGYMARIFRTRSRALRWLADEQPY